MDQQIKERNDDSRRRLHQLVARLDDQAMQRKVNDEWTVAATLAHLALFDQSCVARWDAYDQDGSFVSLSIETVELVNAASLPTWRALTGKQAGQLALDAAEAADARVAGLSDAALAYAKANGREYIFDRSSHRVPHLDEIERALER